MGKHCVPCLLLPLALDAQFGTPYPRSAGFDTDKVHFRRVPVSWLLSGELVFQEAKLCVSLVHRSGICGGR